MKQYFAKDSVNNFNIGVFSQPKNKKLEILSGIDLSYFSLLAAKPEAQSPQDFLSCTIGNSNYTHATLGIYHMTQSMLEPLNCIINQAASDWLDGEYEQCYPGLHYCEYGSAHLLGIKNLSNNTFLFFSIDFFVTAPARNSILSDPGLLKEYLQNEKIRLLNYGDFSNISGCNFLDTLHSYKNGSYFQEIILNDKKIKEIEKAKNSLEKMIKPVYNKPKLDNKI